MNVSAATRVSLKIGLLMIAVSALVQTQIWIVMVIVLVLQRLMIAAFAPVAIQVMQPTAIRIATATVLGVQCSMNVASVVAVVSRMGPVIVMAISSIVPEFVAELQQLTIVVFVMMTPQMTANRIAMASGVGQPF